MKKSIKLIVSCLLISICCFCVAGCSNNAIKLKVDKTLENGCNVGIIIKDSYCSNNCPIVLQNGFIYRLYNADSWTLLDRFNRDLLRV